MRTYVTLTVASLTIACAGSQTMPAASSISQSTVQPTPQGRARVVFPFRAVALKRDGTPSDDVSGTAEVLTNELRVVMRSGYLELGATSAARPRTVQAVLAYGDTA